MKLTSIALASLLCTGIAMSKDGWTPSLKLDCAKVTAVEPLPHGGTAVRLLLNPASGSNIRVAVWLPKRQEWNGRLFSLGNSGMAGSIDEAKFIPYFQRGFAVATTDLGTNPAPDAGIGNPEVWKDFGYRATHLMTVAAKELIESYYGKCPDYSYFHGHSTGGQQAIREAQLYPEDYDGIVATLPAHCRTPLHAYFLWTYQILKRCNFTSAQEKAIIAAANRIRAASEIPPFAGKCISDPRFSEAELEMLIAAEPSLTPDQREGLRLLFDGPRHAVSGKRIFDGIPPGSNFWPAAGNLYLFNWVFGKDADYLALDFGKDFDRYTAALAADLTAENPDLAAFRKRGGKLLMTSGTADSVVPFQATMDYYEKVIEQVGSLEETQSFFRYFLIPGMAHHGSGPGINALPDWVAVMTDWCEKGRAPESLEARRYEGGNLAYTVPLYPYPAKTAWSRERGYYPVSAPRGGVKRVAPEFLPAGKTGQEPVRG